MENKEKPSLLKNIINAFLTALSGAIVTIFLQWIAMESAIVTISPSAEMNGQYITIISVNNLKKETLSNLSLYFGPDLDIFEIESSDPFELQEKYIEVDSIAPKAKYSVILRTDKAIEKDQIIAESEYKIQLNYPNEDSPLMLQLLQHSALYGGIMFLIMLIEVLLKWKQNVEHFKKTMDLCNEAKEQVKSQEELVQKTQEEVDELKAESDRVINETKSQLLKENQELKSYYTIRIAQLSKELTFWRDTIRKLLYDSRKEFQTADKVIETVTATLKTYTTREHNDEKMDEMLYLAQLIADSKELHSSRNL